MRAFGRLFGESPDAYDLADLVHDADYLLGRITSTGWARRMRIPSR